MNSLLIVREIKKSIIQIMLVAYGIFISFILIFCSNFFGGDLIFDVVYSADNLPITGLAF